MDKYICEEMKKFREYLDHNNIEWVDTSSCEEFKRYNIYRTQFLHKNKKVSVINGYGSYGGFSLFSGKNEGLLEVMIEGSDPVGWLTCDEAIELIFGDKRKESKMNKIKIGKTTYIDSMGKIHQKDNSILCCGKNIEMISHIDGDDYFISDYLCECGNVISCYSNRKNGE